MGDYGIPIDETGLLGDDETEYWKDKFHKLEAKHQWISVEDRLPPERNQWNSCWWLVKPWGSIPFTALFIDGDWMNEKKEKLFRITHWMPLPQEPTNE